MAGGNASIGPHIGLQKDSPDLGTQNETTPAEQRVRGKSPVAKGPVKNDAGNYLPGRYPVTKKIKNSDGKPETFKMTVEDR